MTDSPLDALTSWHADWKGLRVAVLGLSVTGFSVADTLAELGAEVVVYSESADAEYERLLPVIGVRAWVGPLSTVPSDMEAFAPQVVIASPGFAPTHAVIAWAQDAGIAVWGDIELAWRVRDKVVRADGSPRRLGPHHGDQRQDHDDAADGDDAGRGRSPRRPGRQHRHARCSTRCATPPVSTCWSSSSRATSSGT